MDRWWTKTQCTYPQQEPFGPPKFLAFLSTHATLFVDPGRPSESSPMRSLCVGFWYRYTIATCFILGNEAVSRLQGVRSPLRPIWFPVYASAVSFGSLTSSTTATLGTGGWLDLTRQDLPSCKKRQASWRTTASSYAAARTLNHYGGTRGGCSPHDAPESRGWPSRSGPLAPA